ncbi:MAG: 50S ribosomal protein L9 [Muribaculaceae bacterium]|nr:50S ribosomal protein L9 [Muribaculaceae bacterium]
MKIILKEDVANLGYKDDVVEVKNGYGRNYLIPQGKAILATPSALKVLTENLRQRAHKLAKIKADAEAVAAKLQGLKLTIPAKVSETGTIFGSVGNIQIAEALSNLGYEIDRKIINVKEAVKQVGSYVATVKLHKEVSAEIPFDVVAENAPAQEAGEEAPAAE